MGIVGGGLLGYDFTLLNQLKLGLEGFGYADGINLLTRQNYSPQTSYNVNIRRNGGVRLLPGYEFTPGTIAHVIVGYSYATFNANDNGDYGLLSTHFSKNGFQGGLGVKTPLFKNLSIRGDMLYTTYSAQTSYGVTTTVPSSVQTYRNQLATWEGNLSLIYKFNS